MNDDFETRLATLVRTAVADAPPPPSIADVHLSRDIAIAGSDEGRHVRFRVAVGLAAAAMLIVGLVLTLRPASSERQDPAVGSTNGSPLLPEHVLPTVLPAGWQLVDIAEAESSAGAYPATQLFRRTSDGATVRLQIQSSEAQPQDTMAATATTAAQASSGIDRQTVTIDPAAPISGFREAGTSIYVDQAGVTPADTEAFLRQLTATGTGSSLRYQSPDTSWVLETTTDQLDLSGETQPYGTMVIRNNSGAWFSINLFTIASNPDAFINFGVPEVRGDAELHVSDTSASRRFDRTVAYANSFDPAVMKIAVDTLAALDVADFAEWVTAADELAARTLSQPQLAALQVGGIEVTTHLSNSALMVCATDRTVRRCHEAGGSSDTPDPSRAAFILSFNVSGRLVHVGSSHADTVTDLSVTSDHGPAAIGFTKYENVFIVAAVADPAATTMTMTFNADSEPVISTSTRPSI